MSLSILTILDGDIKYKEGVDFVSHVQVVESYAVAFLFGEYILVFTVTLSHTQSSVVTFIIIIYVV